MRGNIPENSGSRVTGFVPSTRLVTLIFMATVPLLLSFYFPALRWIIGTFDGILVVLTVFDWKWATRARIEVSRVQKSRLNVGLENQLVITLKNLTDKSWIVCGQDSVPETFGINNIQFKFAIDPLTNKKWAYRVTPTKRGKFTFENIYLRVQGPIGLCWLEREYLAKQEMGVYPDLSGASRLVMASASRDLENLGLRKLQRDGFGSEFARLREYVQGDSLRDVDWKATARWHRPVTRVRETERSQTVLICLDAGRTMAARVDSMTKLDHAINAALFLAFIAIQNGDRVGIAVFADGVRAFLPPSAGKPQYRRIVDLLYRTEPILTYVDYQALFRELATRLHKRALVAVLTDLIDEEQAQSLLIPLKRLAVRHVPICITLRDQAVEDLICRNPQESIDVFKQAVAIDLLEEREYEKAKIAKNGIHIIDSTPRNLSIAAVNRYLEIKRRGLI